MIPLKVFFNPNVEKEHLTITRLVNIRKKLVLISRKYIFCSLRNQKY